MDSRPGSGCGVTSFRGFEKSKPTRGLPLLCALSLVLSCTATTDEVKRRGRPNGWARVLLPLGGKRAAGAYNHTLTRFYRGEGDCLPHCPAVDVWRYQYKTPAGAVITDSKPVATRKEFWKVPHEARIIAVTLYGNEEKYLDGLLDFLDSFRHLRQANARFLTRQGVADKTLWGYETFTLRVYVAKRNPDRLAKLGPLGNATAPKFITRLLERGAEVAFVDNALPKVGRDATFWRFLIAQEPMPSGQRVRYLLRDVDWKLTAAEAFTVGEWIHSGLRYHRMHLMPACMGPLTASIWGGVHEGAGPLWDMAERMRYFPYRFAYGDDELFLRELVWPVMQASGSVLTHVGNRGPLFYFGNPYHGSCEEPTGAFCDRMIRLGIAHKQLPKDFSNQCRDLVLPKGLMFPVFKLAYNMRLSGITRKVPEAFTFAQVCNDPEGNARILAAVRALSADFAESLRSKQAPLAAKEVK